MISEVVEHKPRHVVVALAVLRREHEHVATHGDRVHEQHVQAPPHALGQGGVGDSAHHQAYAEVSPPHGHVGQLVVGGRIQDHVIDEYENPPRGPVFHEFFLLLQLSGMNWESISMNVGGPERGAPR